jgi:hypothetical protein
MRHLFWALLIIGASPSFPASATAQELNIRVPLPPIPKIVVPKPPPRKIRIQPGVVQSPAPMSPIVETPRDDNRFSRGRHRYEYYPEAQVYFDPARQLYFFMQANRWAARATLPPEINVRIGPRVVVQLDSERPYEFHEEIRRYYPYQGGRHRGGYDEGFDDGYQQGFNDGYSEGYSAAYRAAYEQGYRDGYRECTHDHDKHGRDRGRR